MSYESQLTGNEVPPWSPGILGGVTYGSSSTRELRSMPWRRPRMLVRFDRTEVERKDGMISYMEQWYERRHADDPWVPSISGIVWVVAS